MNTKTGEYITELEVLQVVAGDVLKENKRVRLVGEAEETSDETTERFRQLDKFAEYLFSLFGVEITKTELRFEGQDCYFAFRDNITLPTKELSNWYPDRYTGEVPSSEKINLFRGDISIGTFWNGGKPGFRPILRLHAHEFGNNNSCWVSTYFEGNVVEDDSLVDDELVKLVEKACDFIRSKGTIQPYSIQTLLGGLLKP